LSLIYDHTGASYPKAPCLFQACRKAQNIPETISSNGIALIINK